MSQKVPGVAAPQPGSEQIHADHLIIVSNRGPVEYSLGQDNTLRWCRGVGGLVTALLEAMPSLDTTWVALAMTDGDRLAVQQAQNGLLPSPVPGQRTKLRYVTVPKDVYHYHYDIVSNQVLWFLQHYLFEHSFEHSAAFPPWEQILRAWDHGYSKANAAIADAVSTQLEQDSSSTLVLIHDYHLYLAPTLIRHYHPAILMQQFIHIPWPEVRYWQSHLPTEITQAIYNGLLDNDILGFQTKRDVHNFLEGVPALLSDVVVDGEAAAIVRGSHRTLVRDYPISISVWGERRIVQSAAGKQAAERIRPLLGEQTIMRVDRIEPTKNIVRGFHAYAYLLERHPELAEKVIFLAFLVPSRQGLPIYRRYREEVLQLIEDINQQFGRNEWTPIRAFVQNDRTQALAALQFYDVLLVNSLIDGMNLVAKEGSIVNQRNGVLILSRTCGAFQQLKEASLPISPADLVETAEALYKALTLRAEERRQKAELARQSVEQHDLKTWVAQQARDINALIDKWV